MTSIDTSNLKFITPPECQGQMVEYSYATHDADSTSACIVERCRVAGSPDSFALYIDPTWEDGDGSNLEFWNGAPELGEQVQWWVEGK
jgi:hypothetical protein